MPDSPTYLDLDGLGYFLSKLETYVAEQTGEVLPTVTASDDGKFLRVVNGEWAASSVQNARGAGF